MELDELKRSCCYLINEKTCNVSEGLTNLMVEVCLDLIYMDKVIKISHFIRGESNLSIYYFISSDFRFKNFNW